MTADDSFKPFSITERPSRLNRDTCYNKLTPEEERVILRKGTEKAFTGKLLNNKKAGYYLCRHCDSPVYRSDDKFESHCGWPSFDDEIPDAVQRLPDADGLRTEICCRRCGGHLGHVFLGEQLTAKNTRHCVNSISLRFIPREELAVAYFASGCFWGPEYFFRRLRGVIDTDVGYMGGQRRKPTYKDVCTGSTGHAETVRVRYDPKRVSYERLVEVFFETHDFTQINRQGPDIGPQYRSVIFTVDAAQRQVADQYIERLRKQGDKVATALEKAEQDDRQAAVFWPAEEYHQRYYDKKKGAPGCHVYRPLFSPETRD